MEKALKLFIVFTLAIGILVPPLGYLSVLGTLIFFIMIDKIDFLGITILSDKSILILMVSIILSVLFSNMLISSIAFLILITLQFAYYAMIMYYQENKGAKSLFNILNYMAIIVSAFGIYQFLSGKLEINKHWVGYSSSLASLSRVYSTLYNPNVLAAYLVINICFIASWILFIGKEPSKQVSLIFCSLCLILTHSRGAFISLIFALIIIYALTRDMRVLIYGAIMLILFILLNYWISYERINITKINKDSSSIYRIEIWRASVQIFLQNPLFGNGIGTLWYSLSDVSTKLWGVIYHAHNIFLHIASETGILGLFSFMHIVFKLLMNSWEIINDDGYDRLSIFAALGAIGSVAAIMIHGLIDAAVVVPTLSLILMNYYALVYFALRKKYNED